MKRRISAIILALCLAVGLIPSGIFTLSATAAASSAAYYYRDQLSVGSAARMFYDAMEKMYIDGTFKTGVEALDLVEEFGGRAADYCAQHAAGGIDLIKEYGAGRDAFYADFPNIFYVDFSALTVRITYSQADGYHLYLGAGRYPTYYTDGFTNQAQVESAIKEYDAAFKEMLSAAAPYSDQREQVIAIHDWITKRVSYTDELAIAKIAPDDMGFIRTAYGALVKRRGVCESYTRAFKAAMDALGIPCVMVSGVYRHSDKVAEAHIWNEVYLGGRWYAVDATMDDPVNPKAGQYTLPGDDGYESHEYLLVGEQKMSVHHYTDGTMSPDGRAFDYPSLGVDFELISEENSPLVVKFKSDAYDEEILEGGVYCVSYMGMNATEMKKNGYYLLMRYKVYDVETGWEETEWHYYMPEVYGQTDDASDHGDETWFYMPHVEYVEFGVTIDPSPVFQMGVIPDMFFHGDETLLLARSGLLHNESGTYRAAPASLHGEPSYARGCIGLGATEHFVAYFNDILVTPEVYKEWCETERVGEEGYKEAVRSATANDFKLEAHVVDSFIKRDDNGAQYQNMRNIRISFVDVMTTNGLQTETKIEFDYTTSSMWLDDNVAYVFYLTGLVGAYSGKTPDSFGWVVQAPCAICAYRSQGFDYNTHAKPVLVTDGDLSMDGWKDSEGNVWDGTEWDEKYKSKLMLVVSETGAKDEHNMENMITAEGEDVLSATTYNISLTLCKKQWAELADGMSVRIQLGFPVGYGPDDEGVTFKAYHFDKDPNTGEILGVEEIPCTITKYGLLIECKKFSPFAVVAVADDGSAPTEKTVAAMADVGGKVEVDGISGGRVSLKEGESCKITVTPDAGYIIDSVEVSGAECGYNGETGSYTFTLSYEDIKADSSLISARFAAQSAILNDKGTAVVPKAVAPAQKDISINGGAGSVKTEADGSVKLYVANPNPNYEYNWYKIGANGEAIHVGSGSSLTLTGTDGNGHSVDNSGEYYCEVTVTAGSSTASSNSVTVNVISSTQGSDDPGGNPGGNPGGSLGHIHSFTLKYNGFNHWIACDICGAVYEFAPHSYDSNGVCSFCGFVGVRDNTEFAPDDENEYVVETPTEPALAADDPA